MIEAVSVERRHQRVHAGHNCWVLPEEERFVTPELIENSCLVGTADSIVARLRDYEEAGLDEIIVLPGFDLRYAVIERIAADLLRRLAQAQT